MNDSTLPEDGEPTSFAKVKNWCKKHEPKFRAAGAVGLAVGLIVVRHLVDRQDAETAAVETYEVEDIVASEPVSATEATREPRQSPSPHVRKLHKGWNASEEKKAQYKAETGDDLAPGTTWVHPSEDEDPGEAAA
ncbi:hypothetical protein [Streptomyces sp. NBC_01565]|uniref:hypothetical protein n=1 Tax=unclassified Streptomyces TaxID=2593676 RepID=UPI00225600F2|nr:hypothetical protein [Streptomyces sp. NBC_01565]MCX4540384.1 hypothetical protein [Streptomyces sp. NBC_01565]